MATTRSLYTNNCVLLSSTLREGTFYKSYLVVPVTPDSRTTGQLWPSRRQDRRCKGSPYCGHPSSPPHSIPKSFPTLKGLTQRNDIDSRAPLRVSYAKERGIVPCIAEKERQHGSAISHERTHKMVRDDTYLTRKEASEYLRCSKSWLDNFAWSGGGPLFFKVGTKVLYRKSDLDQWVSEGIQRPIVA